MWVDLACRTVDSARTATTVVVWSCPLKLVNRGRGLG